MASSDLLQYDHDEYQEEVDNFLKFTGAEPVEPNAVFILVLGVTGSGKSSFISCCTNKHVELGHDILSCTRSLAIFHFEYQGQHVYLIDTPGFDDTNREDIETLKVIAHYLSVGYANRVHIGGVVFLHRISDNRMTGTMKRNIAMFKSLCGPDSLSNVAVATTMWPEDADLVSQRRRDQLLDTKEYFGDVCAEGARMFELRGVLGSHTLQESSLKVVSHLMDMHRLSPVILQIQHELVDQQLPLEDTQAGRVICEGLHRSQAELSDQLAELRKSMQNALERGDQESLHNLRQLRRDMQLDNERTEQNSQSLATSLTQMHEEELSRLMRRLDALEDQWQSTLKTKEAELEAARAQRLEALRRSSEILSPRREEALAEEIRRLRLTLSTGKDGNNRVRKSLGSGLGSGLASGLASGGLAAAATIIIAGAFCIVC